MNYARAPWFLILIWFLSGAILLAFFSKGEIALWINRWNSPFADFFFTYVTVLGDGIVFGIVGAVFLFIRFYYFFITMGVVVVQTVVVQVLKRFVFQEMPRPRLYFEHLPDIHYVEGLAIHSHNAFPSGHSATAFAVFTLLAVFFRPGGWIMAAFALAALAAISRVYLMQHFFIDVYFGSIIGFVSALAVYFHFESRHPELKNKPFFNRPLIRI